MIFTTLYKFKTVILSILLLVLFSSNIYCFLKFNNNITNIVIPDIKSENILNEIDKEFEDFLIKNKSNLENKKIRMRDYYPKYMETIDDYREYHKEFKKAVEWIEWEWLTQENYNELLLKDFKDQIKIKLENSLNKL